MALVISRKTGQSLYIGDDVTVYVAKIENGQVKLSITAPHDKSILRDDAIITKKKQ